MTKLIPINQSNKSPDEVYIGRPGKGQSGKFGNPIRKDSICHICQDFHSEPGETLPCYQIYLAQRLASNISFKNDVKSLQNKTLVCFCKGADKCHGTILIRYINILNKSTNY